MKMNCDNTIQEELKEISPFIATLSKSNVYDVPENYFTEFSQHIISIAKANSTLLSEISETPFNIPNGYFTIFPQTITKLITNKNSSISEIENELNEVAPLLNTISKKYVYNVPENYFKTLEINNSSSNNKIKSKHSKIKRWMLYAVAAAFTSIAVVSAVHFIKTSKAINLHNELAKTSDDDLNDYLDNNKMATHTSINEDDDIADLFQEVETDDIIFYLHNQTKTD